MQDDEIFDQSSFDGSRACRGRGACRADGIRIGTTPLRIVALTA